MGDQRGLGEEVSPEISRFAQIMQRELDANAHKGESGTWALCAPEILWNDLMYHAAKMIYAMKHGESERVEEFAADVANMAMMTLDAYNVRHVPQVFEEPNAH